MNDMPATASLRFLSDTPCAAAMRAVVVAWPLLALGGCGGDLGAGSMKGTTYEVQVAFNDQGCPVETKCTNCEGGANYPTLRSGKDKIFWQSVTEDWEILQPMVYRVVFSPFVNASIKSGGQGKTNPKITESKFKIPVGTDDEPLEYKYTIWAFVTCPDAPLDPRFKVR